MTSSNGRPRLLASRFPLDQISISIPPRGGVRLVCGDCGTWQPWKRGLVKAHPPHPPHPADLCPGSHQQVFIDLTADQLHEARAAAAAHARATARSTRKPRGGLGAPPRSTPDRPADPREGYQQPPPLAPAIHQIAARRSRMRDALRPL